MKSTKRRLRIRRWQRDGWRRRNKKVQGGDGGGGSHGMILSRGCWMLIQATARDVPHSNIAGGRSHGGVLMETAMGMTEGKDGVDGAPPHS